jgi:hypothetical protein
MASVAEIVMIVVSIVIVLIAVIIAIVLTNLAREVHMVQETSTVLAVRDHVAIIAPIPAEDSLSDSPEYSETKELWFNLRKTTKIGRSSYLYMKKLFTSAL